MVLLILSLIIYLIPETIDAEIKGLKEKNALLQNEATLAAERANATQVSVVSSATSVSEEATVMANNFNLLGATATSIAAIATARAPKIIELKELETKDLFGHELSITLDGYSCIICSSVTFTVHSLGSAHQTFEGVDLDEAVFYKGQIIILFS
jgi:hypothetical protein